jgi:hypothetical protein
MTSEENPWSTHGLEERTCEFCGDLFYAHHGLQRYCPEKNGRINYCKNEQKKLLSQSKLADMVIKLAKGGVTSYEEDPTERNIQILAEELGPYGQITTTSEVLDKKGYSMSHYTARVPNSGSNELLLVVGSYTLEWIGQTGEILTFKIKKS